MKQLHNDDLRKLPNEYGDVSVMFHSHESTWTMTIKNKIYVEANVMNMYAKFQLHPLTASEKIFEYFKKIYPLYCQAKNSNSTIWTKFI